MVELIAEGDSVLGAVIEWNGQRQRVRAAKGVILASGGLRKSGVERAVSAFTHEYHLVCG